MAITITTTLLLCSDENIDMMDYLILMNLSFLDRENDLGDMKKGASVCNFHETVKDYYRPTYILRST